MGVVGTVVGRRRRETTTMTTAAQPSSSDSPSSSNASSHRPKERRKTKEAEKKNMGVVGTVVGRKRRETTMTTAAQPSSSDSPSSSNAPSHQPKALKNGSKHGFNLQPFTMCEIPKKFWEGETYLIKERDKEVAIYHGSWSQLELGLERPTNKSFIAYFDYAIAEKVFDRLKKLEQHAQKVDSRIKNLKNHYVVGVHGLIRKADFYILIIDSLEGTSSWEGWLKHEPKAFWDFSTDRDVIYGLGVDGQTFFRSLFRGVKLISGNDYHGNLFAGVRVKSDNEVLLFNFAEFVVDEYNNGNGLLKDLWDIRQMVEDAIKYHEKETRGLDKPDVFDLFYELYDEKVLPRGPSKLKKLRDPAFLILNAPIMYDDLMRYNFIRKFAELYHMDDNKFIAKLREGSPVIPVMSSLETLSATYAEGSEGQGSKSEEEDSPAIVPKANQFKKKNVKPLVGKDPSNVPEATSLIPSRFSEVPKRIRRRKRKEKPNVVKSSSPYLEDLEKGCKAIKALKKSSPISVDDVADSSSIVPKTTRKKENQGKPNKGSNPSSRLKNKRKENCNAEKHSPPSLEGLKMVQERWKGTSSAEDVVRKSNVGNDTSCSSGKKSKEKSDVKANASLSLDDTKLSQEKKKAKKVLENSSLSSIENGVDLSLVVPMGKQKRKMGMPVRRKILSRKSREGRKEKSNVEKNILAALKGLNRHHVKKGMIKAKQKVIFFPKLVDWQNLVKSVESYRVLTHEGKQAKGVYRQTSGFYFLYRNCFEHSKSRYLEIGRELYTLYPDAIARFYNLFPHIFKKHCKDVTGLSIVQFMQEPPYEFF